VDQKPIVGLSIVYHRVDEGKQKSAGGRGGGKPPPFGLMEYLPV
jgi:hypothetical protein